MIIAVDFDGTIIEDITYPSTDYRLKPGAAEAINKLAEKHTIVLCTARYGWYLWSAVRFINQLKLPISIRTGKPVADVYIDDRNIDCTGIDWEDIVKKIHKIEGGV